MIDSIKRYVQEQNMFAEGDYVVAGVSGGADSICPSLRAPGIAP